jgi:general secretion pathway protein K
VAWRTPLTTGTSDSETAIYQAAGKTYGPRHGPFQHVNELDLLIGLPPWLVERALPYLTVYSGRSEVNVLSATPEVLAALPGLTPALLQQLMAQRGTAPQDVLRAQIGMAANYISLQPSAANRIDVDVRFTSGRRIHSQVVVLVLDKDTEPYRVLSWRDEELSIDKRNGGELQ